VTSPLHISALTRSFWRGFNHLWAFANPVNLYLGGGIKPSFLSPLTPFCPSAIRLSPVRAG